MKVLMFDFDGVIVDTIDSSYEITRRLHNGNLDRNTWKSFLYGNMFEDDRVLDKLDTSNGLELDPFFIEHGPMMLALDPVAGISELIRDLSKDSVLSVVSSGPSDPIDKFLARHGLREDEHHGR